MEDLRADFLRLRDPTGYRFAVNCLEGGWQEWLSLLNNTDTATMIGQWQDELSIKLASLALARIMEAAEGETRDALSANKYIYETLTRKEEKKSQVGRPSKEAILKEASRLVDEGKVRDDAYNRIFKSSEA